MRLRRSGRSARRAGHRRPGAGAWRPRGLGRSLREDGRIRRRRTAAAGRPRNRLRHRRVDLVTAGGAIPIRRYDMFLVSLDPTQGAEIRKTRPCVIVSPDEMNRHTKTVIVAPPTSPAPRYPTPRRPEAP